MNKEKKLGRKIAIITFYDAYNYGAFWQAKCLKDFINNIENVECEMLRIELRKDKLKLLKQILRFALRKITFHKMVYEIQRYRQFQKFSRELDPQSKHKNFDIYVFGSDEIWNIKRKINRRNQAKILWGIGLPEFSKKISYAPSINEAKESDFKKIPLFKENVSKFDSLSARDRKSVDVLEKVLNKKVELVLDPTLLQGYEYFKMYQVQDGEIGKEKYLLLYAYSSLLTQKEINLIKSFAREKDLKVIGVGSYIEFADESLLCSPEQILTYFERASYVFTNTFHGTMFSIIYRKNCGILESHQTKVDEAISQFGLDKLRVLDLAASWNLDDRNISVIWDEIYEAVEKYKIKSIDYLTKSIDQ